MTNVLPSAYFASNEVIDWQSSAVYGRAQKIMAEVNNTQDLIKLSFEWVRDQIHHSMDIDEQAVTCSASEVLAAGHGLCFAKSHLLAALLRANGIASSFCYQRLSDGAGGFVLHGYCSVWMPEYGWYPLDARGNKAGIDVQFCPPQEPLAYRSDGQGERHYRLYTHSPLPEVVKALRSHSCVDQVMAAMPNSISMG